MKKCGFLSGEVACYKYALLPSFALRALAVYQELPEPISAGNEEDRDIDAAWQHVLTDMINLMRRAPKDIRYGLLRKVLSGRTERMT